MPKEKKRKREADEVAEKGVEGTAEEDVKVGLVVDL